MHRKPTSLAHKLLVTITVATILLAAFVMLAVVATANPTYQTACGKVVVLAVDGTKGPNTPTSLDPNSPLNDLADRYRSKPDTVVRHIAYPGGMVAGINGWNTSYDQSLSIGKDLLRNEIRTTDDQCGDTTFYVLLGFSQGAQIVGDVAAEIDSDQTGGPTDLQKRVEVHLYADPRTGIASHKQNLPGITLAGPRPPYKNIPVTQDCAPGDMVCDPTGDFVGYLYQHVGGNGY